MRPRIERGSRMRLWAEALNAATYVHNRMPTKALGDRTPYEVLYVVKRDVSQLRAFGTYAGAVGYWGFSVRFHMSAIPAPHRYA
jgi:hypothetical protein